MSNKIFSAALLLLTGLLIGACNNRQGCTLPQAENYDPAAKQDDNSCYFLKRTMVWWNETEAQKLEDAGLDNIYFLLEGNNSYYAERHAADGRASEPSFDFVGPIISTQYGYYYSYNGLSLNDNGELSQTAELIAYDEDPQDYWVQAQEIGRWEIPLVPKSNLVFELTGFNP